SVGSLHLVWTVATDDQAVDHYDIYINGTKLFSSLLANHTVFGLDSLIPYNISVRAVDASGNVSPFSNQVTYIPENTPPGTIPGVPSSFSAVSTGYNMIRLTWTDTSANENGFEVVRSRTPDGAYLPVAIVAANTTNFTDSGLAAQTRY